jgi:hypothetical protein
MSKPSPQAAPPADWEHTEHWELAKKIIYEIVAPVAKWQTKSPAFMTRMSERVEDALREDALTKLALNAELLAALKAILYPDSFCRIHEEAVVQEELGAEGDPDCPTCVAFEAIAHAEGK